MADRQSLEALDDNARKAKTLSLPPLSERLETQRASMKAERMTRLLRRTRQPSWRRKLKHFIAQILPASSAA